nr:MAG TPA: hypothetical protein [Caudoviricetes sp.]
MATFVDRELKVAIGATFSFPKSSSAIETSSLRRRRLISKSNHNTLGFPIFIRGVDYIFTFV